MRDLFATLVCVAVFFVIIVTGILVSFIVGVFVIVILIDISRDLARFLMMLIMAFGIGGSFSLCTKLGRRIMRSIAGWPI